MKGLLLAAVAVAAAACLSPVPDTVQGPVETDIVFFNYFEAHPAGPYTLDAFVRDWNGSPWELGVIEGRVSLVEGSEAHRGRSLRILYPGGVAGFGKSGATWTVPLGRTYQELYCAYRLRLAPDFDFARGGKFPGLIGGRGNTYGQVPDGTDGWSARMVWQANGNVAQNVYHVGQEDPFGQIVPWNLGGQRRFERDTWHYVEHHVVMNTPGEHDGIVEGWFDGQLALDIRNFRFRDVDSLGIDALLFTTFFGGDVSAFAPSTAQTVYFDDLMIATSPITH